MRTAFAGEGSKIGRKRFKLAALCGIKQRDVQRQPGTVQLDQTIGWNFFFLDQCGSSLDQLGRAFARFASCNHHLITLLGGAMHAPVMSAKFALGQL